MISLQAHRVLRLASLAAAVTVVATALIAPGQAKAQTLPGFGAAGECLIGADGAGVAAGTFACDGVDLLAIVPSYELSMDLCDLNDPADSPWNPVVDPDNPDQTPTPMTGSDMWGWTTTDDMGNRREFALQGLSDVVAFIEVTDPTAPIYLGCMAAPTPNFLWRDVKVYSDHVYVVGDFSPELVAIPVANEEPEDHHTANNAPTDFVHGLQILNLRALLDIDPTVPGFKGVKFGENDYVIYEGFDEAHNIVINEETGFATAVASDTCGAEFHMLDLSEDPLYPEFLGCFNSELDGAVHDAQCATYRGDDFEHFGKEICLGFMERQFAIMDMSDPSKPKILTGNNTYPGLEYVHQGWFTEDQRYVLSNDEQDEMYASLNGHAVPIGTRTYVWDVQDLDNPIFKGFFSSPTKAIDHNMYFKGDYLHQANYTSGYRILKFDPTTLETTDPNGVAGLEQVAFFDTVPSGPAEVDGPAFGGVWSGYFHYENDAVALSQLNNGELFILKPQDEAINNADNTEDPTNPEDPNEPVDVIPEAGRVHGSGYLYGMTSFDGDSDSDSDSESDSDFEKINFSFDVKVKDGELKGKLKLKDKELNVKIEAEEITSLISGGTCNGVTSDDTFIFRATGSLNAAEGVEFRVCGQDNGKGKAKDGEPADRFFLECVSAGCNYNTADRTMDDAIDGGNIHLHDPIVMAEGSPSGTSGAADSSNQMVITLDPMLADEQLIGQALTLTAVIETADGTSLQGQTLTLHSKHENGATYANSVISDALGNAVFTVTPLQGATAYWVSLDGVESNRVTLTGSL